MSTYRVADLLENKSIYEMNDRIGTLESALKRLDGNTSIYATLMREALEYDIECLKSAIVLSKFMSTRYDYLKSDDDVDELNDLRDKFKNVLKLDVRARVLALDRLCLRDFWEILDKDLGENHI